MKLSKYACYLVLLTGLFLAFSTQAEDIDLYAGGQNVTGVKANVLIVLDNSANWNSNAQGWPGGLAQGQSELTALSRVLGAVQNNGSVNVGLMMFAKKSDLNVNGGYVRFALRDISDTTNLEALQSILDGMAGPGVFNDFQADTASSQYGDLMHEAYRYFSGKAPIAGGGNAWRDYPGNGSPGTYPFTAGSLSNNAQASSSASAVYTSPLSAASPCAKNYIIFIGNGYPSNGSPTPSDSAFTNFNLTQIFQETSSPSKTTWADEWARYLHDVGAANPPTGTDPDGNAITADGAITTFTIDVYKDQQDLTQTKLLKSMANVGGGEYYAATSESAIEIAIGNIFNQIQAVNSVFTSASLPISVNTQGTYLNQVYMGVFRPDGGGRPRWLGNLKHYKFGLTTDVAGNDSIFLADQNGVAAVNVLTGFIKTDASSFWSSSVYPDPGFWAYKPSGVGGQYDAPDGDLVEKGAVAQKLRTLDPRSAATTNMRKVYTCWPSCSVNTVPGLFSTTNSALVTKLTGADKTISTLTRTDNTVTVTTSTAHGFSAGNFVTISGSSVPAYNDSWTVLAVPSTTTFTFSVSSTPAITATPTTGITVSGGASTTQTGASLSFDAATSYVNVFLASHGFRTGQTVVVSGAAISAAMSTADIKCTGRNQTPAVDSPCEYNGTFQISVIDSSNFRYLMPSTNRGATQVIATPYDPPSSVTGNLEMYCKSGNSFTKRTAINTTFSNTSLTGLITVNLIRSSIDGACFQNNNDLTLSNLGSFDVSNTGNAKVNGSQAAGNFTKSCAGTSSSSICTLTFQVNQSKETSPIAPGDQTGGVTGIPTKLVKSITRAGNVATLTTEGNHGFTSPSSVTVVGADQAEYNGEKLSTDQTLRAPTLTTLTYTVTVGPTTPATGGTVAAGSGVNANALIEWIRGVDNKEDENQNDSLTDVRASIHGDVLHSRPLVVNYGPITSGSTSDVIMAFYGGNDGLFRAVLAGDNAANGVEKWAFVANEHYDTLGRLYNNSPLIQFPTITPSVSPTPTKRNYFFDGNIGIYQTPDRATTHLYITVRRGGRFIYALDVSDPFTPKFLWKKSNTDTGFSELGYTFSEPKVVPIQKTAGVACKLSDSTTYTRVLILGAGYDDVADDSTSSGARTPTMGRGVFVLNPTDGSVIKLLQPKDSSTKFSVAAEVTLLDSNSDGCVDRLYAVDTGANIYRYDLTPYDGDAAALANWKAYKVAALGDTGRDGGSDDRRFLHATDAVHFSGPPEYTFLMVGSGNREQPLASNISDSFFVIKDTIQVGDVDTGSDVPSVKNLGDLTQNSQFDLASGGALNLFDSSRKGYYISLENGEKTVNAALTVAGVTYFGTNKPTPPSPSACTSNLGIARGYAINFASGTAVADRNADGSVNRNDLYTTFTGGGLPPSPVTGVVEVDGKYIRFVIGGGGIGTAGSTIEGVKVQADPASTRTPVYWYFKKD